MQDSRPTPETISLITFRIGEIWFGIPTAQVERITDFSEGLLIVSLLDAVPGRETKDSSYLAASVMGKQVGFKVDELGMVRNFPARALYPVPEFLTGQSSKALWGVVIEKESPYFLLNLSDAVDHESLPERDSPEVNHKSQGGE